MIETIFYDLPQLTKYFTEKVQRLEELLLLNDWDNFPWFTSVNQILYRRSCWKAKRSYFTLKQLRHIRKAIRCEVINDDNCRGIKAAPLKGGYRNYIGLGYRLRFII